jgi:uncharacterized membrane protein (UPF0127 family)
MLKWFTGIAIGVLLFMFVLSWFPGVAKEKVEIEIAGNTFIMWLADSSREQQKGLSDTSESSLEDVDGMLFTFDTPEVKEFHMQDMRFNLDVVWVASGKVVKISKNVPAPLPGEEPAIMSSAPFEAEMVLEFPAGFVGTSGIVMGHAVEYPVEG